jgi:hypothetical protein
MSTFRITKPDSFKNYNQLINNDGLRAQLAEKDKQHLEQE